jgi:hypothetical protein
MAQAHAPGTPPPPCPAASAAYLLLPQVAGLSDAERTEILSLRGYQGTPPLCPGRFSCVR